MIYTVAYTGYLKRLMRIYTPLFDVCVSTNGTKSRATMVTITVELLTSLLLATCGGPPNSANRKTRLVNGWVAYERLLAPKTTRDSAYLHFGLISRNSHYIIQGF